MKIVSLVELGISSFSHIEDTMQKINLGFIFEIVRTYGDSPLDFPSYYRIDFQDYTSITYLCNMMYKSLLLSFDDTAKNSENGRSLFCIGRKKQYK